jgi:hypothetical protein
MMKVAAVVWIMLGTVLAGAAVGVVLSVPSLASEALRNLPVAGIGGYLVAIPFAWLIARRIMMPAARQQ